MGQQWLNGSYADLSRNNVSTICVVFPADRRGFRFADDHGSSSGRASVPSLLSSALPRTVVVLTTSDICLPISPCGLWLVGTKGKLCLVLALARFVYLVVRPFPLYLPPPFGSTLFLYGLHNFPWHALHCSWGWLYFLLSFASSINRILQLMCCTCSSNHNVLMSTATLQHQHHSSIAYSLEYSVTWARLQPIQITCVD